MLAIRSIYWWVGDLFFACKSLLQMLMAAAGAVSEVRLDLKICL